LIVRGVPADVTVDEVQLFFESDRFCPAGGLVEKVEFATDKGTILTTVTFEHANGNYPDAHQKYVEIKRIKLKLNDTVVK